jgi:hypothetical protein
MSRSRGKLRWRFIVPSGLPISFTYQSVGPGTQGDMGSFLVHGVVLGCMGTFEYDGALGFER